MLPPCCQMSHAVGETTTISFESESWTDARLLAFPEVLLRQSVEERQSEVLSRDQTNGNPVGFLLGSLLTRLWETWRCPHAVCSVTRAAS